MNSASSFQRQPIGPNDFITVQDRYLYYNAAGSSEHSQSTSTSTASHRSTRHSSERSTNQDRFFVEGIAFPVSIPPPIHENELTRGWGDVLEQLAELTEINTIRLYEVNCTAHNTSQYDAFFEHAAKLGIYVIAPLTSADGGGVLDRSKMPPACYPKKLYDYGVQCLNLYTKHPNVVMGVVGNEVLNSLESWRVAPCIWSYANDLQKYMTPSGGGSNGAHRKLPLAYAAQHDSFSAAISPEEHMRLTVDYLTCAMDAATGDSMQTTPPVDVMGVNIESWCSSLQTFEHNEDGSISSYKKLYDKFDDNVNIPLVFTEEGCSKHYFNKDNGLEPRQSRDWKQIPADLEEMKDVLSGFVAYTYDGNPDFRMMKGVWNGRDGVLEPAADFEAFAAELHRYHQQRQRSSTKQTALRIATNSSHSIEESSQISSRFACGGVLEEFRLKTELPWDLYPIEKMPSWYKTHAVRPLIPNQQGGGIPGWRIVGYLIAIALLFALFRSKRCRSLRSRRENLDYRSLKNNDREIQAIATTSTSYDSTP